MASETLGTAASAAATQAAPEAAPAQAQPRIATSTVVVISCDPIERQSLVVGLSGSDALDVVSAAGFHMAVPMLWSAAPDLVIVGALSRADRDRLPELRHHAGEAVLVAVASEGREYAAGHADVIVTPDADLLELLGRLRPVD
jgi:hypothetical protein